MKTVEFPDIGPIDLHKHRQAKNLRITVRQNGTIRVTVPWWVPYRQAEKFVLTRLDWIQEQKAKLPPTLNSAQIERLRAEAKAYIPERTKVLAAEGGFSYNRISIKNMTSRWGSCSSRKNLNFSLHLMRLSSTEIDYIIWHELCHTIHMNHGSGFWDLLESVCPAARTIDRQIKRSGIGCE